MTDQRDLNLLVARANPVDDPHDIAESLDLRHELLSLIEERSTDMTTTKRVAQLDRQSKSVRPVAAFAAALAVLLLVIGGSTLLLSRSTPEGEPSDIAPTTTQPEAATVTTVASSAATTPTTTSAPMSTPAEPRVRWEQVDGRVNAPGGGVAIGDGRVAVSSNEGDDVLWYSDDLVTWHLAEVDTSGPVKVDAIAHGPGGWVAVGSSSNGLEITFRFSDDATRWVTGEIAGMPDNSSGWVVRDVAAGGPGWVAAGWQQRDGRIWVSSDGLSWETVALPEFDEVKFDLVTVEDDVVVVVGHPQSNSQPVALRWASEDGRTWTQVALQDGPVGPETHTISTNPATGQQVALNKYGVWVSDDGSQWEQLASSNGIPPYAHPSQEVVWLGDTMIGGSRDFMYESSDGGKTWVRTGPTDDWPFEFAHARRLFTFRDKVILLTLTDFLIGTLDEDQAASG